MISKYPFDNASTLLVDNHIFPYNLINDIFIMLRDSSVPLYITRVLAGPAKVPEETSLRLMISALKDLGVLSVFIANGAGTLVAYFLLKRLETLSAALIKTNNGTICGGIKLDPEMYAWLYSVVKNTRYGELKLLPDALILHANTLACVSYIGYLGLSLNGVYLGNKIHLNIQHNIKAKLIENNKILLNAFGDYDTTFELTLKLQKVNGVELKGKSLIIKPSTLGDLRVITLSNRVRLAGVLDI